MSDFLNEKEYGGYLPIEMGESELYSEKDYPNIMRYNSARYAIVVAVINAGWKKVWIPYYMCESVIDSLKEYNVDYSYYSINESFEPVIESMGGDEGIMIANYFGIKDKSFYEKMYAKYKRIVFDNTQAFFFKPILYPDVYYVYSPRKFVGVADGAYLISSELIDESKFGSTISKDYSAKRTYHLLEAIEQGTNAQYLQSIDAENDIADSHIRKMSLLTRHILSSVNYDRVASIRNANYNYMARMFGNMNEIDTSIADDIVPMVYPLLIKKGRELRTELVNNKIYVPRWWKWILEEKEIAEKINGFESHLSYDLIPLPIDQRYDMEDMEIIASFLKKKL